MTENEGKHVHWHHIDPEEAREVFAGAAELTAQIVDQNDRYNEAQGLFEEDDEIREIVVRGIVSEQEDTQLALAELDETHEGIYSQIGQASLTAMMLISTSEGDIAEFEKDYEEKSAEVSQRTEELKGDVNRELEEKLARIRQLSPKAYEQAEAVLRGRSANSIAQDPIIQELEAELLETMECIENEKRALEEKKHRKVLIDELFYEGGAIARSDESNAHAEIDGNTIVYEKVGGGVAWPLPLAMRGVAEYEESQQAFLDEMPVEPVMSASAHRRMDELRSHHIDEPDASLYATVYLIDKVGKTVTVDELAQALYSDEVRRHFNESTIRTRVTTILGPARNHVAPIMLGEGFVLQYGIRLMFEKTAEITRITGRRRIYRAVTIEEANNAAEGNVEQKGEGFVDTFKVEHVAIEPRSAQPGQLESVTPEQDEVSAETADGAPESDADRWERDLKRTIGETLNMLEENNLLDDSNGVQLKQIRAVLGRRGRFTDRGLERVADGDLLPEFAATSRVKRNEVVITPQEMVIIELFNERSGPLRKDSRSRVAALEIIDRAVEAYFHNKEQEAKTQQKPVRRHQ